MSLLDMDEAIISLGEKIEMVYSPLVDAQEFPDDVDITLVEGAISSEHDREKIREIRQRTRVLVSLGDCAVTGNVPAMRNNIPVKELLQSIYENGSEENKLIPADRVPPLLKHARPLREFVEVDHFLPGCPPSAHAILALITGFLEGHAPESAEAAKFG